MVEGQTEGQGDRELDVHRDTYIYIYVATHRETYLYIQGCMGKHRARDKYKGLNLHRERERERYTSKKV